MGFDGKAILRCQRKFNTTLKSFQFKKYDIFYDFNLHARFDNKVFDIPLELYDDKMSQVLFVFCLYEVQ